MKKSAVKLDYENAEPRATPWQVASALWLLAGAVCAGFLWLCLSLAEWQVNNWGGVGFIVCVCAVGLICLINAVRPLLR